MILIKRNKNLLFLLFITLVIFLSIIITACSYEKDYSIKVSPDKLYFDGDGKFAQSVHIKTDGEWFISSVEPYISVDPKIGDGYGSILHVFMESNNHISPRESIIEIRSFEEPENIAFISVYQYGNYHYKIIVTPDILNFPADGKSINHVEIETESEWFVTCVDSFVSVAPKSGKGNAQLMVQLSQNNTSSPRHSHIEVNGLENMGIISIKQDANKNGI